MTKVLTAEQLERKRAYNRAYSKRMWRVRRAAPGEKERLRAYRKQYRSLNAERCREQCRKWHRENRAKMRVTQRRWNARNHDRKIARERQWRRENIERQRGKEREFRRRRKFEMIAAYGGACSCCGEARFEFLSVDHVGGRKSHGHEKSMSGIKLYAWLRRNGYPKDGFRCLCLNCNTSFGFYGYCPHERERQQQMAAD